MRMRELDLYEVLRYVLAGVVGLTALVAICPDARLLFGPDISLPEGAFVGGIALAWGAVIYALHRAVVYPILNRLVLIPHLWKAGCRWRLFLVYWPLQEELQRDRSRWQSADLLDKAGLREWAAQVHFLYCSAWVLLSAWGLTLVFCCQRETPSNSILCVQIAALVALAAFLHDARLTRAESQWLPPK